MWPIYLILHNIRSTHNVGSILRTADGAGVTRVYLSGYTPTPIDRFGRVRADVAKVALGAEESVPWEYADDVEALIDCLKQEGATILGLEQDKRAVPYTEVQLQGALAIVLGEEVAGIPHVVRNQCHVLAEIPMRGKKESLNVSVSAGIILYHVTSGT